MESMKNEERVLPYPPSSMSTHMLYSTMECLFNVVLNRWNTPIVDGLICFFWRDSHNYRWQLKCVLKLTRDSSDTRIFVQDESLLTFTNFCLWSSYIYTIYEENYPFQHFWVEFFLSKIPSIFNTNNTYNKYIRINLNIKIKM